VIAVGVALLLAGLVMVRTATTPPTANTGILATYFGAALLVLKLLAWVKQELLT
jgi:hypothetical protein